MCKTDAEVESDYKEFLTWHKADNTQSPEWHFVMWLVHLVEAHTEQYLGAQDMDAPGYDERRKAQNMYLTDLRTRAEHVMIQNEKMWQEQHEEGWQTEDLKHWAAKSLRCDHDWAIVGWSESEEANMLECRTCQMTLTEERESWQPEDTNDMV
tara:strand:+ start:6751 stop:7209 length:459 start_codon:yes stop_codon:yes gene_type:complete